MMCQNGNSSQTSHISPVVETWTTDRDGFNLIQTMILFIVAIYTAFNYVANILRSCVPDEYQATSFLVSWSSNMCSFSMVYVYILPSDHLLFPLLRRPPLM